MKNRCSGGTHIFSLELLIPVGHRWQMSKVEQIEGELEKLSPAELRQVRDWLENFVEDKMEFKEEFESAIQQSEREMKSGVQPRSHRP